MNFREMKVPMFAERESMDEAIKYAGELAGSAGTTAAMVAYNTLLEQLAGLEEIRIQADKVLSIAICCGRHTIEDDEQGQAIVKNLENREFSHHLEIWNDGMGWLQIALKMDKRAIDRVITVNEG